MKVTGVKTFLVTPSIKGVGIAGDKNWLFVKVVTDDGIHGWGEAYTQSDRDRTIEEHVLELERYLVGRDPFAIKHFSWVTYDDFSNRRGSMELYSALSAIEQALWDIVGKKLGVPIYQMLGGPCRNRIRVYANGWYRDCSQPDEYADKAVKTIKRGFTALKFDPFPKPWRSFISKDIQQSAIEVVRAVRLAVGPNIDLLIEGHRRLSPMNAINFSRKLEEFNPFWYEEPTPADNIPALAKVRECTGIPVVTGETLYTKTGFREVFERRAADIINPDVCNCGGILELKEIAAMAEPYYIAVAPHNYNSTTIGLAATIQAVACMPNFLITEYFLNFEEAGAEISVNPFQVDKGYINLPKGPGLGLELDEQALLEIPYVKKPTRDIRHYNEEGP